MDGAEDGLAARRHLLHHLDQLPRVERIQAGRWLVAEQERRVSQDLGMRRRLIR